MTEKRLVVVLGAGASCRLGRDHDLPLMKEWATVLCRALDAAEPGLAAAVDLHPDMEPGAFEDAIGDVVRYSTHLELSERFVRLGGPIAGGTYTDQLEALGNTERRLELVIETLRSSMYKEFGLAALDPSAAKQCYERFLSMVEQHGAGEVVFATTNYDAAVEIALDELGRNPNDGFRKGTWQSPQLEAQTMIDWNSSHAGAIPILHLHGAVGWYRDEGAHIIRNYADRPYDRRVGVPIYLPPDPRKQPLTDPVLRLIWDEFAKALIGCTHILVIGHSLNDQPITDAINSSGRHANLAIGQYFPDAMVRQERHVGPGEHERFPNRALTMIPVDFGPDLFVHAGFVKWLD